MIYRIEYSEDAKKDRDALDNSAKMQVEKVVRRVAQNPLPKNQGGYGEPLGHKQGMNLTGLCKVKLKKLGIRIIYRAMLEGEVMRIIVIAARADDEVYEIASKRISKV